MLANEHGRSNYNAVTDMQLCHEIDNVLIPSLVCNDRSRFSSVATSPSIYSLSEEERAHLGHYLQRKYRVSPAQIRRCLALPSEVQFR